MHLPTFLTDVTQRMLQTVIERSLEQTELVIKAEVLNLTLNINDATSPQALAMLRQLIAGQAEDKERDLTTQSRIEAARQQANDYSNRIAAALAGVGSDLADLKQKLVDLNVDPAVLNELDAAIANIGGSAAAAEALDSAYPAPTPTPTPEPEDPTEIPPVEEAPGQEVEPEVPNP